MKILLVTSFNKNLVKLWACQETSHVGSLLPPVDLCSIAAVLKQNKQDVKIVDPRLSHDPVRLYRSELQNFNPDALVINISTTSACQDYKIIKETPSAVVKIAFGTHAQAMPFDCFEHGIDFVLSGDPEGSITKLIECNFQIESERGIISKKAEVAAIEPNYADNLDALPFPSLDMIELKKYHTLYIKSPRFTVLLGSRGCPFKCTYCLMPHLFGSKIRVRSVGNIVDEMQYDYEKYGITEFMFLDATFNIAEERTIELGNEIIKRNLGFLKWSCNMRVSPISEKSLKVLKNAGCRRIYYGVEDVSLLEEIKKNVTLDDIKKAFLLTRKSGIKTVAFIMLFPNRDKGESLYVSRIIKLLQEIKADSLQCNVVIPFPGTVMYEATKKHLSSDWSDYDPNGDKLPYTSPVDLIKVKKRIYLKFALTNPGIIIRTLFEVNFKDLSLVVKKFLAMLSTKTKKGR